MTTNLEKYKNDLEKLIDLGATMSFDLEGRSRLEQGILKPEEKKLLDELNLNEIFEREYQKWYTEASSVIRQLVPDRLAEFQELYKGDGKRKEIKLETYHIQDWLNGVRSGSDSTKKQKHYDDFAVVTMRFRTQYSILKAVRSRFDSSLHDMRQFIQADLFDSELDAAKELVKFGFLRSAGAVAGVVLEKHLEQVAINHMNPIRKKNPAISDLNDHLKNCGIIDVPIWRKIQFLGDLRNLCDHNKHREPTKDEIEDLINGVDKITKSLF